ncbi:MAG: hypothetical protein ACK4VM_02975 [Bosea sp. (in: a-proteobacteria)]
MPADAYAVRLAARITVLAQGYADEGAARHAVRTRFEGGEPEMIVLSETPVALGSKDGQRLRVDGSVEISASDSALPQPVKTLLTALMMHLAEEPAPLPARARQRDALTSQILDLVSGRSLRLSPPARAPEDDI